MKCEEIEILLCVVEFFRFEDWVDFDEVFGSY